MALDQTQNFVEVDILGTYTSTDTTISLESGGASEVPDPVNGEYNLVWFDALNNAKPSFDPEVEIVRVTGRDTGNDTLTVQRGRENTSAVAHDTGDADYRFLLTPTSKLISDIDSDNFETNSLTVDNTTISIGGSGTPEADNLAGNNGTNGQFLRTDGTNLSFETITIEETVTTSSNLTTNGQTTVFADVSSGTLTVTLATSDAQDGSKIRVVDKTGNASNNTITVNTESNETINGQSNAVINNNFEALTCQSDGSNWFIVSRMGGGGVV